MIWIVKSLRTVEKSVIRLETQAIEDNLFSKGQVKVWASLYHQNIQVSVPWHLHVPDNALPHFYPLKRHSGYYSTFPFQPNIGIYWHIDIYTKFFENSDQFDLT